MTFVPSTRADKHLHMALTTQREICIMFDTYFLEGREDIMKHESILTPLVAVRRRHRTQRVIEGTSWGLFSGSLIALPLLIVHLLGGLSGWNPLMVFVLPTATGVLLGAIIGRLLPLDSYESARRIDQHYQLKDRLLTALKFLPQAKSTPVQRLQLNDAIKHAEQVDPQAVQPYRLPQNFSWSMGVTLLAFLVCLLSPFFNKQQAVAASERLQEVVTAVEILREDLIEKVNELAEDNPDEKEIKELADKLKELLAQLDESATDRKESLGTLSEMEAAIRSTMSAFQLESVDVSMKELAEAFSAAEATRSAGQAMKEGQYSKAADELEKLDSDSMSKQERRTVSEQMRKAAEGMNRRGQKSLSQATLKMAEALEKNDSSQCKEGSCQLAGECRKQSLRKGICEGLEGKLSLLGLCKSDCNGVQCKSNGNGSNDPNKSNQSSKNWGTGTAGNPTSGEETNLDSTRERKDITGMMGAVGDSEYEQLKSSEAQQEISGREFREAFQEYRKMSEAVLQSEPIPLGQRQMIQRYFESIRPSEDK